jgi:hypothetical protein
LDNILNTTKNQIEENKENLQTPSDNEIPDEEMIETPLGDYNTPQKPKMPLISEPHSSTTKHSQHHSLQKLKNKNPKETAQTTLSKLEKSKPEEETKLGSIIESTLALEEKIERLRLEKNNLSKISEEEEEDLHCLSGSREKPFSNSPKLFYMKNEEGGSEMKKIYRGRKPEQPLVIEEEEEEEEKEGKILPPPESSRKSTGSEFMSPQYTSSSPAPHQPHPPQVLCGVSRFKPNVEGGLVQPLPFYSGIRIEGGKPETLLWTTHFLTTFYNAWKSSSPFIVTLFLSLIL